MKILISVLFVLSNLLALHNFSMAENDDATPTALFKAVFWDRFTSRSLVYALCMARRQMPQHSLTV